MAVPRDPTRPSPDGLDADALAVLGGVPPVVWLAAAASDALSPQVASALLDEHTEHGDVVVDVDDDVAFAAAAAETGRRHHALGGDHHLTALADAAGYVDMVLLHWPRPQAANPRWLLVACRTLLRHDTGVLVVAVGVPAAQRIPHLAALTGAARAVGLRQVRHVAVLAPGATFGSGHHPGSRRAAAQTGVNADTAADRPADDSSADTATGVGQTTPHTDLLIFAAEEDHHD